jgi:hypothetical protein
MLLVPCISAGADRGGYDVTAIEPAVEPGTSVQRVGLTDTSGRFDAGVAVVSLHHVDPLEASCAHLATLLDPEGVLVIDEIENSADFS